MRSAVPSLEAARIHPETWLVSAMVQGWFCTKRMRFQNILAGNSFLPGPCPVAIAKCSVGFELSFTCAFVLPEFACPC